MAVIGDFAETPRYQGAGSSAVNSIKVDSFLDCLAESGLNSAIQSAKDEYHALPADKQTATRKVSIVMGKSSELQKLEADCDKQVDAIVEKMRTLLQENGQSTELADQVNASYKAQKSAMYASLKSQLLG